MKNDQVESLFIDKGLLLFMLNLIFSKEKGQIDSEITKEKGQIDSEIRGKLVD